MNPLSGKNLLNRSCCACFAKDNSGANIGAGDTGFRVFKLDTSNLKTWDAAPIDPQAGDVIGELANRMNAMIHRVKPDRSDLDMVFEVMLKLGVPLDFPVAEVTVNGKTAYSVGEDCLHLSLQNIPHRILKLFIKARRHGKMGDERGGHLVQWIIPEKVPR